MKDEWTSSDDSHLDALVRAAAAARGASLSWHPDPGQLAEYCLDALAAEEQERIREHLPLCAACAQMILDLRALAAGPAPGGPPDEPAADLDAEWRRLAARLARHDEGDEGDEGRDERQAAGRAPSRGSRSAQWALAASLVLSVGLLTWGLNLRRELERARQPRTDVALVDLTPLGHGTQRSADGPTAEEPKQVAAAPGIRRFLLQLDLGDLRRFPRYAMRLRGPGGAIAWEAAGVRREDDGSFLLEIPREALGVPGLYRVEIDGLPGDAAHGAAPAPLAAYTFRVPAGTSSPQP